MGSSSASTHQKCVWPAGTRRVCGLFDSRKTTLWPTWRWLLRKRKRRRRSQRRATNWETGKKVEKKAATGKTQSKSPLRRARRRKTRRHKGHEGRRDKIIVLFRFLVLFVP